MYGTRSSVQGTAVLAGRMFYMCTMFSNGSGSLGYTTLTITEANVRGKARRSGERGFSEWSDMLRRQSSGSAM